MGLKNRRPVNMGPKRISLNGKEAHKVITVWRHYSPVSLLLANTANQSDTKGPMAGVPYDGAAGKVRPLPGQRWASTPRVVYLIHLKFGVKIGQTCKTTSRRLRT